MMFSNTFQEGRVVEMTVDFRAPKDKVFKAWTEASILEYLDANGLCNVKVRLNQYAPGGEWSRLVRNGEMPMAWRWTLGMLSVVFYTIIPERVFAGLQGGDHYNPYTNTIVDVRGLRPGTLVRDPRDPVANRAFRVPLEGNPARAVIVEE